MTTTAISINSIGANFSSDSPFGRFELRSLAIDDDKQIFALEYQADDEWSRLGYLRPQADGWDVLSTDSELVGRLPGERSPHAEYELEAASKLLGGPARRAPEPGGYFTAVPEAVFPGSSSKSLLPGASAAS